MEGPFAKQIRLYLKEILPRELTENAWEKILKNSLRFFFNKELKKI
jgi:hypothetical protein